MEKTKQALLVEDDRDICELVRIVLRAEAFTLDIAHEGETGLDMALNNTYHLIILDLMLPKLDGWEICHRLRQNSATRSVPIIMLTARGEEGDKVMGLELGADDYITKPFHPREFLARVNALLRRATDYNQSEELLTVNGLVIDPDRYLVTLQQQVVDLTPKEFELLLFMAKNAGRILTRDQLLERVWGYDYFGNARTIDEHVKRVRQKLAAIDKGTTFIQTVWGVGYKFAVKDRV